MTVKVWLEGHSIDLEILGGLLATGDTRVEADGHGAFYLTSLSIDNRPSHVPFYEAAGPVLEQVNGIARLAHVGYRPVRLSGRYQDGETRYQVIQLGMAEERSQVMPITVMNSGRQVPPQSSPWPGLFAVAAAHPDVTEVLGLLGQTEPASWVDLYKVYEIIDYSGRLVDAAGVAGIADPELKRFKHTACHPKASGGGSRHSRSRQEPPKNPMSLSQARAMIVNLACAWIANLQTSG